MLHWSPREFWAASPWDVMDAHDGWALANGIKKDDPKSGLTADDVRELQRMMDENG